MDQYIFGLLDALQGPGLGSFVSSGPNGDYHLHIGEG